MDQGFWGKLNKPFTILAPMANVTDWAFRQVVIETGRPASARSKSALAWRRPDVFFTEFISADGICAIGKDKFRGELYFTENERPIVVQLFSANPENMYRCAQLAQELGFDGIDINMGCPDKSVEKQGAGAALMKDPELAKKIIRETTRGAGKLPVSVKTRLGFNKIDYNWIDSLLDTDIAALTVHLRTRSEKSKVPAHWEEAGKIVEARNKIHGSSSIDSNHLLAPLIVANGDVKSMDDVRLKAKQYNLDGIMVGRGIFENPWFFAGREVSDPKKRIRLLEKHLENFEILWKDGKNFDVMKRFFKIYINGFPGAKELRAKLMTVKNKQGVVDYISEYL